MSNSPYVDIVWEATNDTGRPVCDASATSHFLCRCCLHQIVPPVPLQMRLWLFTPASFSSHVLLRGLKSSISLLLYQRNTREEGMLLLGI
ncbi:unnamed protein product [Camellia sinensis]